MEELSRQLRSNCEEDELETILVDPLEIDTEKQRQELEKKTSCSERASDCSKKKAEKNQYAMKIEQDRERAEKNEKQIAETEKKRKELQTLISASLEKKAKLDAMLDQTPEVDPPADIEVSIPNPRPAPTGAKPFSLVCAENCLYPVNLEYHRKVAEEKAKAIITRFQLNRGPAEGIDPEAFSRYWDRFKDQDDFFDIEYFVRDNRLPRIRLMPRAGRGASEKELLNPRSRIRSKWLAGVDVSQYYARFYVLPDSYDIYVTARRLFADSGMLAGWEPQSASWVLESSVPGGVELGPPREKPPAPATPPKPANVID